MPARSPGDVVHTVPERMHRNTSKEHGNADLHERGSAGLRFHIRGKFEKFSLDMLITLATRAGKKVELKLAA
ncbi:MAG: hypothetical protein Q7T21_00095 [Gallionella sp.]|nr:hypothetical protein [Gallionella sp.]